MTVQSTDLPEDPALRRVVVRILEERSTVWKQRLSDLKKINREETVQALSAVGYLIERSKKSLIANSTSSSSSVSSVEREASASPNGTTTTTPAEKTPPETPFPERLWQHARAITERPFPKAEILEYLERCRRIAGGAFSEDDGIAVLDQTQAAAAEPVRKFRYFRESAEEQTHIWLDNRGEAVAAGAAAGNGRRRRDPLEEQMREIWGDD